MSLPSYRSFVGRAALIAAVSLLAACGGKSAAKGPSDVASGGDAAPEEGKAAPEVFGEALTGDGPKTLAEGRGQVVIVDFWATFCDPCRKSFPKYQELVDKFAGNLSVIAVSVDDPDDVGADEVVKFAEDLGVSFSIVWDKEKKTAAAYDPPKMPTSYIIDQDGIVRHVHAGFESGEADEISREVEALIAEK